MTTPAAEFASEASALPGARCGWRSSPAALRPLPGQSADVQRLAEQPVLDQAALGAGEEHHDLARFVLLRVGWIAKKDPCGVHRGPAAFGVEVSQARPAEEDGQVRIGL